MLQDKKGMEIAVSTVVGLILGALMFFAGIGLLANILTQTDDIYSRINEQMEQEILDAFITNEPIYIHRNPQTPGRRSDDILFGVGVQNIYDTTRTFNITLKHDALSNYLSSDRDVAFLPTIFNLTPRERQVIFIIVPVKELPKGQHSITMKVFHKNQTSDDWEILDTPKILYINK